MLLEGRLMDLHPLSELPHPLLTKAVESCGADPAHDNFADRIGCSGELRLAEIKLSQWRGGIWTDPLTGVRWLVTAGLALGGHEDRADFYKQLERDIQSKGISYFQPSQQDARLLRQETSARLVTEWELGVQAQMLGALQGTQNGGRARLDIGHPLLEKGRMATVLIETALVRDPDYSADEMTIEILPAATFAGSDLLWKLRFRLLTSAYPPEQEWKQYKETSDNVFESGALMVNTEALALAVARGELVTSKPGNHSHYTHRRHLAGNTIEGRGVRGLCGVFFVPQQDHESLHPCPTCQERLAELPT